MKKIFLFILLLSFSIINAQQLVRDDLNTGFQESTNGIGVIGEVFNQYNANSNIIVETILDITNTNLSTENIGSLLKIKVFPNPTRDFVAIRFNEEFEGKLLLMDINGKLLNTYTINALESVIDLQNYASGTYLLLVSSVDGKRTQPFKLIKN